MKCLEQENHGCQFVANEHYSSDLISGLHLLNIMISILYRIWPQEFNTIIIIKVICHRTARGTEERQVAPHRHQPATSKTLYSASESLPETFPEIFLEEMMGYRVKKASDRQVAPFRSIAASAWFRLVPLGSVFFWLRQTVVCSRFY